MALGSAVRLALAWLLAGALCLLLPRIPTRRSSGFRALSKLDFPLVLDTWGSWEGVPEVSCPPGKQYLTCFPGANVEFKLSRQALSAGARYLSSDRLRRGLRNRSVLFLGDSLTRYLATGLFHELGVEVNGTNVEDVEHVPDGIDITFKWARFPGNITEELDALTASPKRHEFVVVSFCMWSVVFRPGPEAFAQGVAKADIAAKRFVETTGTPLVLADCPFTVADKYHNAAKRAQLTPEGLAPYQQEMDRLQGSHWTRLELHRLTASCGVTCNMDGVHPFRYVAYGLAQVLANMMGIGA